MKGPKVTLKARIAYEKAVWRGLFRCLRSGNHVIARGHGFWYCWNCFHRYPYSQWVGISQWVRNKLGYFAKWNQHYHK